MKSLERQILANQFRDQIEAILADNGMSARSVFDYNDLAGLMAATIIHERERFASAERYAENLAVALHNVYYHENKQWQPLSGDLVGLLTQIDNMTAGLVRKVEA